MTETLKDSIECELNSTKNYHSETLTKVGLEKVKVMPSPIEAYHCCDETLWPKKVGEERVCLAY